MTIITPYSDKYLGAITTLYAHYVLNSAITFDIAAPSQTQMAEKLRNLVETGYPALTAIDEQEDLLGFAYASPYRPKKAYLPTCEVTIYIDPKAQGQGVGRKLMQQLLDDLCADPKFHTAIAIIADEAQTSIKLHQRLKFQKMGYLEQVGFKFERWHGVTLMQRPLNTN